MGPTVGAVVQIVSDDEEIPLAVKPSGDALDWASQLLFEDIKEFEDGLNDCAAMQEFLAALEGEKKSACDGGGDDDDCVMLDGDPAAKAVVVAMEKKPGEDGSEQELQIIAEKGEVACRDFPHPRHLCARLPFGTSSHANHCTVCHCYVCESRAPCPNWGKGTLPTDHCHATDKDKKWKDLRKSFNLKGLPASKRKHIQNIFGTSSTPPSSQQRQVSVPQQLPHSGTTVNQSSVGRVPVASNVSQNQQRHPSIRAKQNAGQVVRLPKAPAHGPTVTGKRFKRSGAAPTVYTPSNSYNLHRSLLNNTTLHPASSRVFQTAQVAPGSNIVAGFVQARTPQRALNAPVLSHRIQVQPASHLQVAPNRAVGTGQQPLQCSAVTTQGTQCAQDSSGNLLRKSWQDAIANVASQLGVSDYNTNPPHGQQSANTQSLHPSQLFAQVRASQVSEPHRNNVPATAQMRHSNGVRLPNLKSGDSVVAMQKTQALCLLNSKSSLTQIETSLNSVVAKPATKH